MCYEPDYLNHAQEIIFQFLAQIKAIFMRPEDSQIDFATGNFFNFSVRPPPPSPTLPAFQPKINNQFKMWSLDDADDA